MSLCVFIGVCVMLYVVVCGCRCVDVLGCI